MAASSSSMGPRVVMGAGGQQYFLTPQTAIVQVNFDSFSLILRNLLYESIYKGIVKSKKSKKLNMFPTNFAITKRYHSVVFCIINFIDVNKDLTFIYRYTIQP